MNCWQCNGIAVGICVFCGKLVCRKHADVFGGQAMIICPECVERRRQDP